MHKRLGLIFWILIFLTIISAGCSFEKAHKVRLNKIDPTITTKSQQIQETAPLRVAVSSILSPRETLMVYESLLNYLENKLERPVILLQRKTYKEVNELIQANAADIAFVCSGGYVAGNQEFGMELLAMPQVKGKTVYQSYIIASVKYEGSSIKYLKGSSFAFTDPMSFSGRIAPVYMLASQGLDSTRFFGRTFFTYSHDNAIKSVHDGIVDAAAVDSMIFDQAVEKNPELAKRVKVIDRSISVGNPPVISSIALNNAVKEKIGKALFSMHEDELGRAALKPLGYDKFVAPDENAYHQLKSIYTAVKEKL